MQARVTRTTASVGSTMLASGTVSTRTSPAPYFTVARIGALRVERERRGEPSVGLDVLLRLRDLLLGAPDGIGAGDEAPRRRLRARDGEQRPRELRRVTR